MESLEPAAEAIPAMAPSKSKATRFSLRSLEKKKRPCYKPTDPEPQQKIQKKKKMKKQQQPLVEPTRDVAPQIQALTRDAVPQIDSVPAGIVVASDNGEEVDGTGKSYHLRVKETLRAFNAHYLHFVQVEEQRSKERGAILAKSVKTSKPKNKNKNGKKLEVQDDVSEISGDLKLKESETGDGLNKSVKRASKRPDLKAISEMNANKTLLFHEKMIGPIPGVDVGHQFYSRAEMVVVGFHSHWLNGIDYMGQQYAKMEAYKIYKFPLAVCIVLSGMYEDDVDNSESVIYTGQGGHDLLGNKKQIKDQLMERGNLALKNSYECGTPVRVVRGHESTNSYCGKIYTYDGLYQVKKHWPEKGIQGFTVFKYKLIRQAGQPPLTTSQVLFTRAQAPTSIAELQGLVCEDISGGQENFCIPATNVVDDPPFPPTDFVYQKFLQVAKNLMLPSTIAGCKCKGECIDPRTCLCAQLNGSDFPYVRRDGGRLVEAKAVVFECGPTCGCNLSCVNRTSQQGLKYRLEVFRTPNKGWAVRTWDTIPSGAPICEYTGILMNADDVESVTENNYIFDIDCLQTMKGLDGRERRPGDVSSLPNFDEKKSEVVEYCIDAGRYGNVARFINHSCLPNLFVQCVLSAHHDIKMAKVMLFAADTIPPLQELTYDYGYVLDSVVGPDGVIKRLACFCGASNCRKRLY